MTKNALVINPYVTDFKLYDEWMHPLGIFFLISLLKQNNWEISYINCLERLHDSKQKRFGTGTFTAEEITRPLLYSDIPRKYKRYGIPLEHFRKKLLAVDKPDIICVGSAMTYWFDGVVATVTCVREIFPDIPLIIGGIAASLIPDIVKRALPGAILFTGSLTDGETPLSASHPLFHDISYTGWKPHCLDAFSCIGQQHLYHGPIISSFGCPLRCTYCASSHLQKQLIRRPVELIIEEMKYLIVNHGVCDFAFYDDALLYQAESHFLPLADAICALGQPVRVHTPNGLHVRWLNERVVEALLKCGCATLRFGYESSSQKYACQTSSKTSRAQLIEKIRIISAAGFNPQSVGVYIMGGLPGQSAADVMDELNFVASLGVSVKPVFLAPVPQTPLFKHYAEQFPQLLTNHLFHNDTFFITQLPGWSVETVEEIKIKARELNRRIRIDEEI